MATNEIICYDLALNPNLEQIKRMLNKAFDRFPNVSSLVFHLYQGWQYQHAYYKNKLNAYGILYGLKLFLM